MRVAVLVVLAMLAGCSDPIISQAQDAVKARLKDPYSVKFENVRKCGGGKVVGYFNGKNEMGAFTGPEQFIYTAGVLHVQGEYQGSPELALAWAKMLDDC